MEKKDINILIVDDSDYSRLNISKIVSDAGYNVQGECSSGQDAIKLLSDDSYHIAIIDVVMPEFNGIQVAEVIKKNFKNTAIIMVSSIDQEQIILESIANGAHDFIKKPIDANCLIDSIEKIINTQEE